MGRAPAMSGLDLGIAGISDATEIGRGSFGIVYRAHQDAVGRTVAVKVLLVYGLDDEDDRRFASECRALGTLSGHSHIVALYDSGVTAHGRPYLVMDHLPGGTLARLTEQHGVLSWEAAAEIGVKLAGALSAAHERGILHRDIKPENVLISAYGEPQLVDFGIARLRASSHTEPGVITASLAHAAPEVLAGERARPVSDVYSLASTVYALLAGHAPFARETDETLHPMLARMLVEDPRDLRQDGVSPVMWNVLSAALAKEPTARIADAREFAARLQAAQRAGGVDVTPAVLPAAAIAADDVYESGVAAATLGATATVSVPTRPPAPVAPAAPRSRRWVTPLGAAAAAIVLACAGGVVAAGLRGGDTPRVAVGVTAAGAAAGTPGFTSTATWTSTVAGASAGSASSQPRRLVAGRPVGDVTPRRVQAPVATSARSSRRSSTSPASGAPNSATPVPTATARPPSAPSPRPPPPPQSSAVAPPPAIAPPPPVSPAATAPAIPPPSAARPVTPPPAAPHTARVHDYSMSTAARDARGVTSTSLAGTLRFTSPQDFEASFCITDQLKDNRGASVSFVYTYAGGATHQTRTWRNDAGAGARVCHEAWVRWPPPIARIEVQLVSDGSGTSSCTYVNPNLGTAGRVCR